MDRLFRTHGNKVDLRLNSAQKLQFPKNLVSFGVLHSNCSDLVKQKRSNNRENNNNNKGTVSNKESYEIQLQLPSKAISSIIEKKDSAGLISIKDPIPEPLEGSGETSEHTNNSCKPVIKDDTNNRGDAKDPVEINQKSRINDDGLHCNLVSNLNEAKTSSSTNSRKNMQYNNTNICDTFEKNFPIEWNGGNILTNLTEEIVIHIVKFLHSKSLFNLRQTSRDVRLMVDNILLQYIKNCKYCENPMSNHGNLYATRHCLLVVSKFFIRFGYIHTFINSLFDDITFSESSEPKFILDFHDVIRQFFFQLQYLSVNGYQEEIRLLNILTIIEILKTLGTHSVQCSDMNTTRVFQISINLENDPSFDVFWTNIFNKKENFRKHLDFLFVLLNMLWERIATHKINNDNENPQENWKKFVTFDFQFLTSKSLFAFICRCMNETEDEELSVTELPKEELIAILNVKNPSCRRRSPFVPNLLSLDFDLGIPDSEVAYSKHMLT